MPTTKVTKKAKPQASPEFTKDQLRKAERKMARAKTELICETEFIVPAIMAVPWVMKKDPEWWQRVSGGLSSGTLAVDGFSLFWYPGFVLEQPIEQLTAVLAHEGMHLLGKHSLRFEERVITGWNIACDHVVNRQCQQMNLQIPEDCIPPWHEDSTPEAIYREYADECNQDGKDDQDPSSGLTIAPQGPNGEANGRSASEIAEQAGVLEGMARQCQKIAKQAGNCPAWLDQMVDHYDEYQVPWQAILAQYVEGVCRKNFNWQRPNRRYTDVVLPTLRTPDFANIVAAGDTSGSMYNNMKQLCSELLGLLSVFTQGEKTELTFLWCDTEVSEQQVSCAEDLKPVGGGGTAFGPVMQWCRDNSPRALLFVTDGFVYEFGEEPQGTDVWWIMTPDADPDFSPPFGSVLFKLEAADN